VRRDEREGLLVYRFEGLSEDRVDAFVSTRVGGGSAPPFDSLNLGLGVGDDRAAVLANRRRLFVAFGLPLEGSVWCRQVHGSEVAIVGEADAGSGSLSLETVVGEADALVTDSLDLPLCVTVADCAPVLMYDPDGPALGLAHAGWSGAVARVASRTVAAMAKRFGSAPGRLLAAIGPSIGPAAYEVGPEVIERARASFGDRAAEVLTPLDGEKALFDLWSANRIDLEEAGVPAARIEVAAISTADLPAELYSHRAEGGRTGRFAAVAALRGS
jgi:purine-nucleoside/S-methyl-5'-thioadenosine phosphorylase / adenosine deaminase